MSEVWTVFEAMKREVRQERQGKGDVVTKTALMMMKALFPDTTIGNAMKLLEHESVLRLCTSTDHFYKVEGSHGEEYHILRELTYCPCPSFRQILARNNQLMCKHLLAIHIGEAMGKIKFLTVLEADYLTLYFASKPAPSLP